MENPTQPLTVYRALVLLKKDKSQCLHDVEPFFILISPGTQASVTQAGSSHISSTCLPKTDLYGASNRIVDIL
jgi:hypothetical protein